MLKFSEKVYSVVKKIPRGETWSYKKIAALSGKSRAYRAVGNILSKNTDPTVPCHRVIRSDGKIGGYNGIMGKKYRLLEEERAVLSHFTHDR